MLKNNSIPIFYIFAFILVIVFSIHIVVVIRSDISPDDIPSTPTTLKGRVVDKVSKKPLDSIRLEFLSKYPYGKVLLDTAVSSKNNFHLSIEGKYPAAIKACRVSNAKYVHHKSMTVQVQTGQANVIDIQLLPMVFFQMEVDTSLLKKQATLCMIIMDTHKGVCEQYYLNKARYEKGNTQFMMGYRYKTNLEFGYDDTLTVAELFYDDIDTVILQEHVFVVEPLDTVQVNSYLGDYLTSKEY